MPHAIGEVWQGPSGRWFTRNAQGKVVPSEDPRAAGKPSGAGAGSKRSQAYLRELEKRRRGVKDRRHHSDTRKVISSSAITIESIQRLILEARQKGMTLTYVYRILYYAFLLPTLDIQKLFLSDLPPEEVSPYTQRLNAYLSGKPTPPELPLQEGDAHQAELVLQACLEKGSSRPDARGKVQEESGDKIREFVLSLGSAGKKGEKSMKVEGKAQRKIRTDVEDTPEGRRYQVGIVNEHGDVTRARPRFNREEHEDLVQHEAQVQRDWGHDVEVDDQAKGKAISRSQKLMSLRKRYGSKAQRKIRTDAVDTPEGRRYYTTTRTGNNRLIYRMEQPDRASQEREIGNVERYGRRTGGTTDVSDQAKGKSVDKPKAPQPTHVYTSTQVPLARPNRVTAYHGDEHLGDVDYHTTQERDAAVSNLAQRRSSEGQPVRVDNQLRHKFIQSLRKRYGKKGGPIGPGSRVITVSNRPNAEEGETVGGRLSGDSEHGIASVVVRRGRTSRTLDEMTPEPATEQKPKVPKGTSQNRGNYQQEQSRYPKVGKKAQPAARQNTHGVAPYATEEAHDKVDDASRNRQRVEDRDQFVERNPTERAKARNDYRHASDRLQKENLMEYNRQQREKKKTMSAYNNNSGGALLGYRAPKPKKSKIRLKYLGS